MKVMVKVPKDNPNDEGYRYPVEVFIDGQLIARVQWVNGPPYYSVSAVDEIATLKPVLPENVRK